ILYCVIIPNGIRDIMSVCYSAAQHRICPPNDHLPRHSSIICNFRCLVNCGLYFLLCLDFFFFQAEDGIRDFHVTGVQTCALPISDKALLVRRAGHAVLNADDPWTEQLLPLAPVRTTYSAEGRPADWRASDVVEGP